MPKYETNPEQIARIDGKNCFLEVMSSAFEIGKVRINFRQYDMNAQRGNRTTGKIDIYMNFKDFDYLYQGVVHNGYLFDEVFNSQYGATISRGGRKEGNAVTARELKLMQGQKKPFVLLAEQGPGNENKMGGFSIIRGNNNQAIQKVMIPLELKDLVHICLATRDRLVAHFAAQDVKKALEFETQKTNDILYEIAARVGCDTTVIKQIINREPPKPWENNNGNNNNNNNGSGYPHNFQNSGGYNDGYNSGGYNQDGYGGGYYN